MTLTKDALVTRLQTQIGITKPESRQIVERLFAIMKETLADGEDWLISGFGKFQVRQKNARRGRNPQTKESLMLRARSSKWVDMDILALPKTLATGKVFVPSVSAHLIPV
jgi:integration host factor subunit alpha